MNNELRKPLPVATLAQIEDTLRSCQHEIRDLRRRNEIMSAQLDVVETFRAALLGSRPSGGMSPDIVWGVDQLLKQMVNYPVADKEST